MANYITLELLCRIANIFDDGYEVVEITEIEGDDEEPTSLSFSVEDEESSIDYDFIDSLDNNDKYSFSYTPDDKLAAFSLRELTVLYNSVTSALKYYKSIDKDSSISRDEKDEVKKLAIDARNMQAKLTKFLKAYK